VLVVEADPAGGTLAAASGWPAEPSLVSLAAATRRGGEPALIWEHCHQLPGGTSVLAAPALGEQARSAVGMLGPLFARLSELDSDVLIDCGRLGPRSSGLGLWERAHRRILVSRPRLADLQALASWLEGHQPHAEIELVTVGDGPYAEAEIADTLGLEVLYRLPWDPDGAEALVSMPASVRQLRMAPLVRSARTLADELTAERGRASSARVDVAPPAEASRSGRGLAIGSRVFRAWRTDTRPHSNGSVPEEAAR